MRAALGGRVPGAIVLVLALMPAPAFAGWNAEPVAVHATTALCPAVAACPDGQGGAIIAWQENASPGGVLRAQHLLASGDIDPSWPAPLEVCATAATRLALGTVADGAGGTYVWWQEDAAIFLTRIAANGSLAAGWAARGRNLGMLASSRLNPSVVADGSGGVYVAWLSNGFTLAGGRVLQALHLGSANTTKDGWPAGGRVLGPSGDSELANCFAIAPAPDGGLWLALATTVFESPDYLPGEVRVTRLTGAGLPVPGWNASGVTLLPFRGDILTTSNGWRAVPAMGLVALAADAGSGAYVLSLEVGGNTDNVRLLAPHLQHVQSNGLATQVWPSPGPTGDGFLIDKDPGAGESLRMLPDGFGGALAGLPAFFADSAPGLAFHRIRSDGAEVGSGVSAYGQGIEYASRGDGGMFIASLNPAGPYGPFSPPAYIQAAQTDPGPGFAEYHDEPVQLWYGDVALAATGDGGAIFAWSQVKDRFGIFAVRLEPVTSVPPPAVRGLPALQVRFVPGVGVRGIVSSVPSGPGTLTLHDALGRQLSEVRTGTASGGDWLFPATDRLPSGVYFASARIGAVRLEGRVAVLR